jgi:type I restriction enzyme R subunit
MAQDTPEYLYSEKPTIGELQLMGWHHIEGDINDAQITGRESFKQILLGNRLKAAIRRINLDDDGNLWLDDSQIAAIASRLERLGTSRLMEANQSATELLLQGTTIEGADGKQRTVHFIDFEHPDRNDFLVVNQFRIDPPWMIGNKGFSIPDIVLFVNGIPLVVIECKSPYLDKPIAAAIGDLLKYSNQRNSSQPEGVEKLFHYNLLMIAASEGQAKVGTIGANYEHYVDWKDTIPHSQAEVAAQLGLEDASKLSDRQTLIAGMLHPQTLLDILQNFTIFKTSGSKTIKVVPRYQQYRAVHKAIDRLRTQPTRAQHGTTDQRGGVIWHTQGSGKSLTMVYLVRKLRTIPELRRFKVVIVTDRTDLEKQLSDTAALTNEPLRRARKVSKLEQLLAQPGADLIFGMIQKFRGGEDSEDGLEEEEQIESMQKNLNPSEDILVLIDEAHRSHNSSLHANLMVALPNCVKIGFTGTPIEKGKKKTTRQIFGSFIDTYNIRQSQDDRVTLPILYEGLEARGSVTQGDSLDQLFEVIFQDKTPQERAQIKARYATKSQVCEAQEMIRVKARDMLRHYIGRILPDGFKAQVVASSRLAAVRYQSALNEARQELVQQLEARAPILSSLDTDNLESLDVDTRFLVQALPHLETIRHLEFAAVISGSKEDSPAWNQWTDKNQQGIHIDRFKKPLRHSDPKEGDSLAILIVKSMLLTGFDAPLEQALYLDRGMKEYELLQAIARVNRVYDDTKQYGVVIDYYGVDLAQALAIYDEEDIDESSVWTDIREELPKLRDRCNRVKALFVERGCSVNNPDACVDLLGDERLWVQFNNLLKAFVDTLNAILPRPEALPFVKEAKKLGLIQKRAADLYRYGAENLNIISAKEKVQALIDQYIQAQGIDPRVPPIDIMALDFKQHVQRHRSVRTQAAEMEFAARHHITVHEEEDPVYFKKLSDRLEEILESLADNWEEKVAALWQYIQEIQVGRPANATGLDSKTQLPFLNILGEYSQTDLTEQAKATVEIVEQIRQTITKPNFWNNYVAQEDLRKWIAIYLDDRDLVPYDQVEQVADKLVQLARRNQGHLRS